MEKTYTVYTGLSKSSYNKNWKHKSLIKDRLTNVTFDEDFAVDYSYDFNTGIYDDIVLELSNVPLNAFIAYRKNNYKDDDDFISMINMNSDKKINIIEKYDLFLIDVFYFKDIININLIKK